MKYTSIVNTLCSKLSWSHLRLLTAIDKPLKREFYIEIARLEKWSVRQLQERINSMLFERTALSRKPEETIRNDLEQLRQTQQVSPDIVLKDPYILDFLNLRDRCLFGIYLFTGFRVSEALALKKTDIKSGTMTFRKFTKVGSQQSINEVEKVTFKGQTSKLGCEEIISWLAILFVGVLMVNFVINKSKHRHNKIDN